MAMGDLKVEQKSGSLLIKRYASRRLYNTETSDYVTLDDIAGFIRSGRDVQIIDLKSGDDLTRQYLLQIIAEHESRGDNVLPLGVLTDLVRSYATQTTSALPEFLTMSLEMFRENQSKFMENMNSINPIQGMPGYENLQAQQDAFLKAFMGGLPGYSSNNASKPEAADPKNETKDDLAAIKTQLSELQEKLNKLS
jgi:polyhydroxyalkanoate synthesis repressor PhaR